MENNIKDFFEKHILPLHDKINSGELNYLNLELNSFSDSYFVDVIHPEYLYLNSIVISNIVQLELYLNTFWQKEPDLLSLIPTLVRLAFELKKDNLEESAELSPFVYAMY